MSESTEKRFAGIGGRIRDAREAKGLSGKELGVKLGYSTSAVSQWEHGRQAPKAEALIPLCQLLKVSTDHILLGAPLEDVPVAGPDETMELAYSVLIDAIDDLPAGKQSKRVKTALALLRRVKGEG